MLGIERISRVGDLLTEFDCWGVHEMVLTNDKIKWIWEEMQKYPSLFGDLDENRMKNFVYRITDQYMFGLEIYDKDKFVGMIYLTDLHSNGAEFHVYFFDRSMKDKVALCRHVVRWLFERFHLHHMSMEVPAIYHATIRLAKHIGFKREGMKRQVVLYGGNWVDKALFGLLSSEIL